MIREGEKGGGEGEGRRRGGEEGRREREKRGMGLEGRVMLGWRD